MSQTNYTVESNQLLEITFESATAYHDPFNTITLDTEFTDPVGKLRRIPAFWAGGNQWRVRYSSSQIGRHRFVSVCSDPKNTGLHQLSGEIDISAYRGDNPLFRHGPICVADDHRHFAHADGTPFLWLGDTWWMGLTKRLARSEDFKQLTADRKNKGFNVVQIVAGLYPDMPAFDERGANEAGFPWQSDYSSINPAYFDQADKRILHLVEEAMVPCIIGAWGFHLPWMGIKKMQQHWRYLVARWGALPVIWAAAGEQTLPWYLSYNKAQEKQQLQHGWTEVIRYLRQTDGFERLVTTHPHFSARESVNDAKLLDFEMQQTGHHQPTAHHAAKASEGWQTEPIMPIIAAESRYEALNIFPTVTTRDTRQAFWAHILNSGCAGHTYGANGIWQVNLPELAFGKSPGGNDWGSVPWNEAMHLLGSTQLGFAKRFLLTLPWYQLQGIGKQKTWKDRIIRAILPSIGYQSAVAAAVSNDGKIALYYLLSLQSMRVAMSRFSAPVYASWFDPAAGIEIPIADSAFTNRGKLNFTPPGKNQDGDTDWLLVLRSP